MHVNSLKPFTLSLAFHFLILLLGWGTFKTLHTLPEPEIKIKIALLTETAVTVQNTPPLSAPSKPASPIPQPVAMPKMPKPLETPVQPTTPAPVAATAAKPSVVTISVPTAAPTAVKTSATEPSAEKAPAPASPPALNVQAQYEDENLGRIRALLLERLRYPKNALRLKQQGDVVITFTLSPSGDASAFTVTKSSEFEILDEAAQTLISTTASAFPKPSKNIRISVPVEYKIR